MFGGREKEKEQDVKKGSRQPPAAEIEDPAAVPEEAPRQAGPEEDEATGKSGRDGSRQEQEEEAGEAPVDGDAAPDDTASDPEKQALLKENENLLALLQRARADLDNFRRISRAQQEEAREHGLAEFLKKLLPVLDNLERALQAARDESVPPSHVEGLEMIESQLLSLLEQEGAAAMEAKGASFDPHYHHAVLQAEEGEEDGAEPGIVLEEFQKGYLYKKKVLRPAMVKVSRG